MDLYQYIHCCYCYVFTKQIVYFLQVPIILFHGTKDERRALYPRLKDTKTLFGRTVFNIVITSYQIPKIEKAFLCEFEWRYLIVDEGHAIKNIQTQLSRYIGFVYKFNISYCAVILINSTYCVLNSFFSMLFWMLLVELAASVVSYRYTNAVTVWYANE